MHRSKPAFTLIELLVVIAIVGLLISILMPSLSSAREHAKASVCMSNLKRIATGMILYVNANRDQFPPFRLKTPRPGSNRTYVNKWGRAKPRWQWFVDQNEVGPVIDPEPFHSEIDVDAEKGFGDKSIGANGESGRRMTNKYFLCPSLSDEFEFDVRNGAYGYNYQYLGNSRVDSEDDTRFLNFPVGITRVRSGGQTVLLADSRGAGRRHGKHSYSLDPPRMAAERYADKFGPGSDDVEPGLDPNQYAYSPVEMRHGKTGNVAFVDTHVEAMTHEQLGYELDENDVPVPIHDPFNGTYKATNKLWNGEAYDQIAVDHHPAQAGE